MRAPLCQCVSLSCSDVVDVLLVCGCVVGRSVVSCVWCLWNTGQCRHTSRPVCTGVCKQVRNLMWFLCFWALSIVLFLFKTCWLDSVSIFMRNLLSWVRSVDLVFIYRHRHQGCINHLQELRKHENHRWFMYSFSCWLVPIGTRSVNWTNWVGSIWRWVQNPTFEMLCFK
jgi:hypothetical protein